MKKWEIVKAWEEGKTIEWLHPDWPKDHGWIKYNEEGNFYFKFCKYRPKKTVKRKTESR